jgi:hypothetical protein
MSRFDTAEDSATRPSDFSFGMSAVGTFSTICTSPASSAATRAGALGIILKVTLAQCGLAPQ